MALPCVPLLAVPNEGSCGAIHVQGGLDLQPLAVVAVGRTSIVLNIVWTEREHVIAGRALPYSIVQPSAIQRVPTATGLPNLQNRNTLAHASELIDFPSWKLFSQGSGTANCMYCFPAQEQA